MTARISSARRRWQCGTSWWIARGPRRGEKRGIKAETLSLNELDLAAVAIDDRMLLVDEVMDRLEKEDPESARVVTLKFFGGLTNKEIASMDGVAERTIERQWAYAKALLFRLIREETA